MLNVAHGPTMSKRKREQDKDLHHLRLLAHPDGTPDSPKWIIEHHTSENDSDPAAFEFSNGKEMLGHIAEHAGVPEEGE
jgi:hypothetical protein